MCGLTYASLFHAHALLCAQPKDDCATPEELLFELMHLKNNYGDLPAQFVQDLDE
jgi:hypothetical protein